MKSLHNSPVGDFTRGGQVTIHFLRMITQVMQKFTLATVLLYTLATYGLFAVKTTSYERYLGVRYVAAKIGQWYENGPHPTTFTTEEGEVITTTIDRIANHPKMQENLWTLVEHWLWSMKHSFAGVIVFLTVFFIWLYTFGKAQRKEKHLRGAKLVDASDLATLVKRDNKASDIKLGGVPLVLGTETAHILTTGSPGSGKTSMLYELLKQIRERGDRVICFSPSGDFISWFYREGKDVVLNPFDARCPRWDIWGELDQPYHYDMISAGLVPSTKSNDPFWQDSARQLVSEALKTMKQRGHTNTRDFLKLMASAPLEQLHAYLAESRSAAAIDPKNEKTAGSIRSSATKHLFELEYLRDSGESFTFRDYVNKEDDSWVFLNAKADQIAACRSLLTTWLDIFTNRLLSLPESRDRRIWLIIDELPALNKIESLAMFLEQGRKFGGCGVIGFQQQSQLEERYGKEGAATLVGMCNSWFCLRQNDPGTAKLITDKFGKVEVEENAQGISYGANDMRDGVSLNAQRKERDLILTSEVMALPNFHGFVKLAGEYPAGRFVVKRGDIPKVAPDFVRIEHDPLSDVLAMQQADLLDLGGSGSGLHAAAVSDMERAMAPADDAAAAPVVSPAAPQVVISDDEVVWRAS